MSVCNVCGYDDKGTGDNAHSCIKQSEASSVVNVWKIIHEGEGKIAELTASLLEAQADNERLRKEVELIKSIVGKRVTGDDLPATEVDFIWIHCLNALSLSSPSTALQEYVLMPKKATEHLLEVMAHKETEFSKQQRGDWLHVEPIYNALFDAIRELKQ